MEHHRQNHHLKGSFVHGAATCEAYHIYIVEWADVSDGWCPHLDVTAEVLSAQELHSQAKPEQHAGSNPSVRR
jgi:hypothetical protein